MSNLPEKVLFGAPRAENTPAMLRGDAPFPGGMLRAGLLQSELSSCHHTHAGLPTGECLPTLDGDVVIVHQDSTSPEYEVWLVIEDGQQERHAPLFRPMRVPDRIAAERLARQFVSRTGTVFLVEQHSKAWTVVGG